MGFLSGKYLENAAGHSAAAKSRAADDSRHRKYPKFQPRYAGSASALAAKEYADIASKSGIAPATLALAWCTTRQYIKDTGSVIIGATTIEQLKENMDALTVSLDADTVAAIDMV